MKKRSGFTLIELLAVIVILAIILVIAIPNIIKIIDKNKLDANIKNEDMFLNAAKKYMLSNSSKVPINIGDTTEITLNELKANNFIGDIKNSYNNNSCNGYVLITKIEQDKYKYTPTLNCNNDISNTNDDNLQLYMPFDDFQEPTENLYLSPSAAGLYMTSAYDGDYGFGSLTNSKWEVDNSDQPIKNIDVQKVSRIDSGVSQRLYVQWSDIITRFGAGTFLPGEEKTVSFYYYGTYGSQLNPYIGGHTGTLVLYSDQATSGNNTTSIFIPVNTNQWNRVVFKIKNTGAVNAVYNWGWMVLHSNTTVATLDNTNFWKFTGIQVEKKGYVTPFVNGIRTGIARDYSGRGNNGNLVLNNTPKWSEKANIGTGAYEFNGINSYISVPNSDGLSPTTLTISAWIKPNVLTSSVHQRLITKNGTAGYMLNIYGTYIEAYVGLQRIGGPNLQVDKWTHVCLVVDETKLKLYINGDLYSTVSYSGTINTSSTPLYIGKENTGYFNGYMDEIRIYKRALFDEEVKQKYKVEAYRAN